MLSVCQWTAQTDVHSHSSIIFVLSQRFKLGGAGEHSFCEKRQMQSKNSQQKHKMSYPNQRDIPGVYFIYLFLFCYMKITFKLILKCFSILSSFCSFQMIFMYRFYRPLFQTQTFNLKL